MKARNTLFAVLMLSLPAISAEHSEMKMTDMSTSASSQEYMAGMKDMHDKMMAAVNESDPDKAFAKGMVAHHEGAIAMAETELKYGKDPKMRKLAQDIIKGKRRLSTVCYPILPICNQIINNLNSSLRILTALTYYYICTCRIRHMSIIFSVLRQWCKICSPVCFACQCGI